MTKRIDPTKSYELFCSVKVVPNFCTFGRKERNVLTGCLSTAIAMEYNQDLYCDDAENAIDYEKVMHVLIQEDYHRDYLDGLIWGWDNESSSIKSLLTYNVKTKAGYEDGQAARKNVLTYLG